MASNQSVTLLENVLLTAADEVGPAIDLGSYSKLDVQLLRFVAGDAGSTIQVQHTAVLQDSGWSNLGDPIALDGTGPLVPAETAFLRYIRYMVGTTAPNQARVSLYAVAKE